MQALGKHGAFVPNSVLVMLLTQALGFEGSPVRRPQNNRRLWAHISGDAAGYACNEH